MATQHSFADGRDFHSPDSCFEQVWYRDGDGSGSSSDVSCGESGGTAGRGASHAIDGSHGGHGGDEGGHGGDEGGDEGGEGGQGSPWLSKQLCSEDRGGLKGDSSSTVMKMRSRLLKRPTSFAVLVGASTRMTGMAGTLELSGAGPSSRRSIRTVHPDWLSTCPSERSSGRLRSHTAI